MIYNSDDAVYNTERKNQVSLLPSFPNQCYNDVATLDLELENMTFKIKEMKVFKVHHNTISQPTEKYNVYKTRCKGAPNNQITKKSYQDLIEALYEHYYNPSKKVLTLEECVNAWITKRETSKAIEYLTALHYRNDFSKYVSNSKIAKKDITKITKAEFISFFEELVGDGAQMRKSTFNNIRTVVNGGFYYANLLDGYDCIDPSKIKTTDIQKKCFEPNNEDDVFGREEAVKLLKYLETLDQTVYTLAIRLCFCVSVRIGEIRAITWEKYNKEDRLLRLDHSMVTKKTEKANREDIDVDYMKKHSKSGKRTLPVSDYAALVLDELKKINGDKKYILQSSGDKPITTNNFNEHLRRYCKEAGIEYHSSHKIRFYAASNMYENGIDEKTIQKNMGHSQIETTRHYDRRKPKMMPEEMVNKVFGFEIPRTNMENDDSLLAITHENE